MNVSLYQAAAALEGSLQRQDVIAENMAATGIPGFKRSRVGFHSVNAEMFNDALKQANKTELRFMLPRVTGYIDFQQGPLMPTGQNNNLSIEGPGFFTVNGPNGTVYTRDGSFRVNLDGTLVTKEGYPLRTAGGANITVDVNNPTPINVDPDGTVSQGGTALGQLEMVTFDSEDIKNLKRINAGYFTSGSLTPLPADESETGVAMGFLEGANTTPSHEMGQLMTTLRHFEANQKIMKIQDQHMGRLIRELTNTK